MYPRVPSYAAICGNDPVASIGQRAFATGPAANAAAPDKRHERELPPDDSEVEGVGADAGPAAVPADEPLKDQGDAIDAIE